MIAIYHYINGRLYKQGLCETTSTEIGIPSLPFAVTWPTIKKKCYRKNSKQFQNKFYRFSLVPLGFKECKKRQGKHWGART